MRKKIMGWCLPLLACSLWAAELHVHYDTGWGNFISIRGNGPGLSWFGGQNATWTAGNDWVYTTPQTGGSFEFKPVFNDAAWSTGANYVVPSADAIIHIYPFFGQSRGSLIVISNFTSSLLGNQRSIRIYLPASYSENTAKHYPVVYMQDGQNLFSAATAAFGVEWQVDETVDLLVGQGKIREAIYVGIDNTSQRMSEYTPTVDPTYGGGNGDAYLDFIHTELFPYINNNYRTLNSSENTLIMGSSLGGLISFHASWTRSGLFGKSAALSASFWWDGKDLINRVDNHTGPKVPAEFYLDVGGNETSSMVQSSNEMRDALQNQGYTHGQDLFHWYDPPGGHNEASWANRLNIPLERLLPWQ